MMNQISPLSISLIFILSDFLTQQIMKRLIKRYVLKAQVDKENDEVNEGEVWFILRFLFAIKPASRILKKDDSMIKLI